MFFMCTGSGTAQGVDLIGVLLAASVLSLMRMGL